MVYYHDIRKSITNHYDKIKQIDQIYSHYSQYLSNNYNNEEFVYNISPTLWFGGKTEEFNLRQPIEITAYSQNCAIMFLIKPQFNALNFYETCFDGIFREYICMKQNPKKIVNGNIEDNKNYAKYTKKIINDVEAGNKQIITCILTLDLDKPVFMNFDIPNNKKVLKDATLKSIINIYKAYHMDIIDYYKYCSNPEIRGTINTISYFLLSIDKNKIPVYICDYFKNILQELEDNPSKKHTILQKVNYNIVDNNSLFIAGLNSYLEKAAHNFLYSNKNIDNDF